MILEKYEATEQSNGNECLAMDTLDQDTFFVLSDFLTDAEVVLFYCTCRRYRDMLPRNTACLRLLEAPLAARNNATKYIQAAEVLSGCIGQVEVTLTIHVNRVSNRIDSIDKAIAALKVASSCIDRVLNICSSVTKGHTYRQARSMRTSP